MKKVAMLAAVTALTAGTISAYAGGIGVVDMKQVFDNSPKVKEIKDSLTKKFSSQKDSLQKMSDSLQADIQKYQKNKAVMNKKDLSDLQAKITTEETQFRQAQSKFQQAVFSAQNDALESFMNTVKKAVAKVAAKKDLDAVLPNNEVLYSKGDSDLTQDVLKALK